MIDLTDIIIERLATEYTRALVHNPKGKIIENIDTAYRATMKIIGNKENKQCPKT